MKIIFLDIDGVLNDSEYFKSNHEEVKQMYRDRKYNSDNIELNVLLEMMNIDLKKVTILKEVTDITGTKIIITSSIKKKKHYQYIETKLIELGLPIIGITNDEIYDRGTGIKHYLLEHEVSEYVILDDSVFDDYDEELLKHLVRTDFFMGGLKEKHKDILVRKLRKKH